MYNGEPIGREPTAEEMVDFYKRQIARLGDFLMRKYDREITAEAELDVGACIIAERLLDYGSAADGYIESIYRSC